MRLAAAFAVAFLLSAATSVSAQFSDREPPRAAGHDRGAHVYVALNDALTLEGDLIEIGPDTLSVLIHGTPREIPLHMVSRIEKKGDPLLDGVLKGALIFGGWCAYICAQGHSGEVDRFDAFLGGFVGGALWGLAIDLLIQGRTTIFERSMHKRSSRGAAVAVSFTF